MSEGALAKLAAILEEGTQSEARRRAVANLKSRATEARQRGVRDGDNRALTLIRAAGVPPRKAGLTNLARLGLLALRDLGA